MDIYSNFPHRYPVPPLNQQNLPSPPPARNKWAIYSIDNSCWNNIIAHQLDTQMFLFLNALARWSKILIFKIDIFTNVLRKIFVKGSMHLIYERNLILFHNPLFQAVDAHTN